MSAIRFDEKDHGSTNSYTDGETWFYTNALVIDSFIDTLIDWLKDWMIDIDIWIN